MNTLNAFLDKYGRFGLDAATAASTISFAAARATTKLGFSVTRSVASPAVGAAGSVLDVALGENFGASIALDRATNAIIAAAEKLALVPISIGESLASASLIAAYSSIDALSSLFPGGEDAPFSIASFINLMRNDWNNPELGEHLPEERFSVTEAARALFAWGTLQGVTYDWQVAKWSKCLSEIPREDAIPTRVRRDSIIHITGDVMLPGINGQLLTADITEKLSGTESLAVPHQPRLPHPPSRRNHTTPNCDLRLTLRRLSKMCLAGYGGASLLFFGVPAAPTPAAAQINSKATEKATLEAAVEKSEKVQGDPPSRKYPWWSMLLGRHDHDIFLHYASGGTRETDVTAVIGDESRMPRFWVLTDHSRQQIVLVFRGTMTLNEVAVDLTCEPEEFEPACGDDDDDEEGDRVSEGEGDHGRDDELASDANADAEMAEDSSIHESSPPGNKQTLLVPISRRTIRSASFRSVTSFEEKHRYLVHGGILKMSLAMGGRGRPVFTAVKEALSRNQGYELVMCGHSLGAGVAGVLGLKWADPKTCLTTRSSGLPVGRRVSVYCFAPPAAYDPRLCELSKNLITSFVYSHDLVSRLSLGTLRDMSRAAVWLCKAEAEGRPEGYSGITRRALRHKMGFGSRDDPIWFLSIRKTLEANMPMHNLYPPGRVLWAVRESDVSYAAPPPAERRYNPMESLRAQREEEGIRLFEVLDVEKVFTQIIFARDMVSSHMAHTYDKVIEDLQ